MSVEVCVWVCVGGKQVMCSCGPTDIVGRETAVGRITSRGLGGVVSTQTLPFC